MNRNWLYVFIGGLIEIVWVSGLKHADVWWEWVLTAAAIATSFWLIIEASKRLPVGTVYAVFTGLGTAGTVVAEMLFFGEPFRWSKTLLIALLLGGVVGLKLMTDQSEKEVTS
ncbi:QacE family quaternary ammonium compound efflux SMR transporter [Paenibacillus sp. CAA11]|uniref:DMT family transporter n=1 Tax=Paenibacillus sp. CAA11 TaxID=1532905 RepID=UPI000D38BD9E|nr:multidrug efflux SMR transporter [Paenibacillus sp. CAA11]AWB46295.1 QacE family quaternary ammonium compound efflux SMR transporter [Paenibacillus sp. CAA11]